MSRERAQLLHLSGPLRGRTVTYASREIRIGTVPEANARFPRDHGVGPRHAQIVMPAGSCDFHLVAGDGHVIVNGTEVRETILRHRDIIQLGLGGPKLRFRRHRGLGRPCKPVRQMVADAREVAASSGFLASTRSLGGDLARRTSLAVRLVGLAIVASTAFAASLAGTTWRTSQVAEHEARLRQQEAAAQQRVLDEQSDALDAQRREIAELREQLAADRDRGATLISRAEALAQIDTVRRDLARRAVALDEIAARDVALRQVLDVYSRGVGLIHGVYTFDPPVRTESDDTTPRIRLRGEDGGPFRVEYMGSGFLARTGMVLSNRHVLEPWWNNDDVAPLLRLRFTPRFETLTITFPGRGPIGIDPETVRVDPNGLDVAAFRIDAPGVPVLPLAEEMAESQKGRAVTVLGYPTGLRALLARSERDVAEDVVSSAKDTAALIEALARRNLISPIITRGALNEVKARRLVYDALTTSGGSGGPVFGADGRVVGVNFAVTRDFDGSNFGVPIHLATALLERPAEKPATEVVAKKGPAPESRKAPDIAASPRPTR